MKYFITVICILTLSVSILNASCVKDCCLSAFGCKFGDIFLKEYISNPAPVYSVNKPSGVLSMSEVSMSKIGKEVAPKSGVLTIVPCSVISEQIKLIWYATQN